jgi:glycosyltransferase involved in cell wall biosynthesis
MDEPISIILTANEQSSELQRNLPLLLNQRYEAGYEVIVVDESSSDETKDVLEELEAQYHATCDKHATLYSTYIPPSSHYLSRKKLAITVGMKATHHEWVVITEANCRPEGEEWLANLSQQMTDDVDVILCYTGFDAETKAQCTYLRMIDWWRLKKCPYRYGGVCIAMRKAVFMARNGFLGNLKYLRGEYDFIVNETDRSRICACPPSAARMTQEEPTRKEWVTANLHHMNVREHLRHAFFPRMLFMLYQLFIHLCYLLLSGVLAYSLLIQNVIYASTAATALVLYTACRTYFGYRLGKTCGTPIPVWKLPFVDLGVAWHYCYYWLRYQFTNKNDFIRK